MENINFKKGRGRDKRRRKRRSDRGKARKAANLAKIGLGSAAIGATSIAGLAALRKRGNLKKVISGPGVLVPSKKKTPNFQNRGPINEGAFPPRAKGGALVVSKGGSLATTQSKALAKTEPTKLEKVKNALAVEGKALRKTLAKGAKDGAEVAKSARRTARQTKKAYKVGYSEGRGSETLNRASRGAARLAARGQKVLRDLKKKNQNRKNRKKR